MDPRLSSPPLPLPVRARDSAPREAGLTQEGLGGGAVLLWGQDTSPRYCED